MNELSAQSYKLVRFEKRQVKIHQDLVGLLWFADGELKNYNPPQTKSILGIYISTLDRSEPSAIYTKLPIVIPKDISLVDRPPYFPNYADLSPEQKGVYIKLLENPYNNAIDIGFVFILYYGLERHLHEGNRIKASEVIIKLRDAHSNKSFQAYSAKALVITSIKHNIGEIALALMASLDKSYEYNFSDDFFLLCAYSFNIPVRAEDIMRMCTTFGFENKNYIKKYPDLFIKTLKTHIREKTGRDILVLSPYILDKTKFRTYKERAYANISLNDVECKIPQLSYKKELQKLFYELLSQTHEDVKIQLADMRKKGTAPKTVSTPKKPRTKKVYDVKAAVKNLPLDFNGCMRAIRSVIKEKIKNNEPFADELTLLYRVACIYSFMVPYSELLQCPGFNIMETFSMDTLFALPMDYKKIGTNKLALLTVTDIKLLEKDWGKPRKHTTLHKMYNSLWVEAEQKLKEKYDSQMAAIFNIPPQN